MGAEAIKARNRHLFIEFPVNMGEMNIDEAVEQTKWKLVQNNEEAEKEAERLGLPWPVYLVRRNWAAVFTVSRSESEDMNSYALGLIRKEIDLIKNPLEHGVTGCGCGVISNLLSVGSGCGCGSSCKCGK